MSRPRQTGSGLGITPSLPGHFAHLELGGGLPKFGGCQALNRQAMGQTPPHHYQAIEGRYLLAARQILSGTASQELQTAATSTEPAPNLH